MVVQTEAHSLGASGTELAPVTVQISLRDADLAFARHVLPHQLRVLGRHAADVLVSLNRPPGSQPSAEVDRLLADLQRTAPQLRAVDVDYSPAAVEWVRTTFFGGSRYPLVDSKGTPIHGYLEPLRAVEQPYVLHLDSDILLGGSGERWLTEAIEVLRSEPQFLAARPLSGPPSAGGVYEAGGHPVGTAAGPGRAVRGFTGRAYVVDLSRLIEVANPIGLLPSNTPWRRVRARLLGFPDVDNLERLLGHKMAQAGLFRIDFGGSGGLWTLHPLHKTASFIDAVPQLVARVEAGDVPHAQRGRYNIHPSLLAQDDLPGPRERLRALFRSLRPLGRDEPTWS